MDEGKVGFIHLGVERGSPGRARRWGWVEKGMRAKPPHKAVSLKCANMRYKTKHILRTEQLESSHMPGVVPKALNTYTQLAKINEPNQSA